MVRRIQRGMIRAHYASQVTFIKQSYVDAFGIWKKVGYSFNNIMLNDIFWGTPYIPLNVIFF